MLWCLCESEEEFYTLLKWFYFSCLAENLFPYAYRRKNAQLNMLRALPPSSHFFWLLQQEILTNSWIHCACQRIFCFMDIAGGEQPCFFFFNFKRSQEIRIQSEGSPCDAVLTRESSCEHILLNTAYFCTDQNKSEQPVLKSWQGLLVWCRGAKACHRRHVLKAALRVVATFKGNVLTGIAAWLCHVLVPFILAHGKFFFWCCKHVCFECCFM